MVRTLSLFYWISRDSPSNSYELKMYAEDGQFLPTAIIINLGYNLIKARPVGF